MECDGIALLRVSRYGNLAGSDLREQLNKVIKLYWLLALLYY